MTRRKTDESAVATAEPEAPDDLAARVKALEAELALEREKNRRFREGTDLIRDLRDRLDAAQSKVKSIKGQIEEAVDGLLVDQALPLFESQAQVGTNGHAEPAPNDAWKELPTQALQDHGIKATTISKLAENDILTLGKLQEVIQRNTAGGFEQWWREGLTGIGPSKAEEIEKAFESFWAAHPEYTKAATEVVEEAAQATEVPAGEANAEG